MPLGEKRVENNWEILTKELVFYGIKLHNSHMCSMRQEEQFTKMKNTHAISVLQKRINQNGKLFEATWKDLLNCIESTPLDVVSQNSSLVEKRLFINSLKDLAKFASFLNANFIFDDEDLQKTFQRSIKSFMKQDCNHVPREVILSVPDYKINLDWIFRTNSILSYLIHLLSYARLGPDKVGHSKTMIKTARGVSGPWANLDLPLLERRFNWSDIAEEMAGRQRDKRNQTRYMKGFEYYNDPWGRVGEGHYWREIRNEPYKWSDRADESPYPHRSILTYR